MITIEIDDRVLQDLGKIAVPFVDNSPNLVIKRLIEEYHKNKRTIDTDKQVYHRIPAKRGYGKLSSNHYRGPILEALNKLGGAGNVDEVLEIVFSIVSNRLSEIDLSKTQSGSTRWKLTAYWERHCMVKDGLIKADSPRGIWELAPEFRASVKEKKAE